MLLANADRLSDRAARGGGKLTLFIPRYAGSTGALATALLLPARRFVV